MRNRPGKLPTSQEVYDQIRWDPRLDSSCFIIGYDARERGMQEMPFSAFIPDGDIPWHRIWYFRRGATVVWDRRTRTDLISGARFPDARGEPAPARTPPAPPPAASDPGAGGATFTRLPVYRHDPQAQAWRVAEAEGTGAIPDDGLVVVTYNVLDGRHEQALVQTGRRIPAILSLLQHSDADLIALQEVTPPFLAELLRQPWVRRDYWVSDGEEGRTVTPYGQVLLSRLPLRSLCRHVFSASKSVIVPEVDLEGQGVLVPVVHLSSNRAQRAEEVRTAQLWTLLDHVGAPGRECLLLGDFNAGEGELDELLSAYRFADAWQVLHRGDPGHTFDPGKNTLAAAMTLTGRPGRYDRVLFCSRRLRPVAARLLGEAPIAPGLHASDHFALRCTFQKDARAAASAPDAAPTHRSAVVIIPPQEAWPAIQAIRARHDRNHDRWMPHINLLYGFLPEDHFPAAATAIARALRKVAPFTLTLRRLSSFAHAGSSTVWLDPQADPPEALRALQAVLQAEFPRCDEQSTRSAAGYAPHLTLAQFRRDQTERRDRLTAEWQRTFHPLSFPVREVALISRRGDEPFAVRYLVSLSTGQVGQPGAAVKAWGLLAFLRESGALPTTHHEQQRAAALSLLSDACASVLGGRPGDGPVLHLLGSCRMGAERPDSDMDVLCQGTDSLGREAFFAKVVQALGATGLLQRARVVESAVVPVLKLLLGGIEVDLACTDGIARLGMDEADAVLHSAGGTLGADRFRTLLRALSLWARARGVHGNAYGFLGGFSYAVLAAWAGVTYPGDPASATVEALLGHLFTVLDTWDFDRPVALSPLPYTPQGRRDRMMILTPVEPVRNSARNVTRSTLAVLREEISRARRVHASAELFSPWDALRACPAYLKLELRCAREEDLHACAGWVEGHLLSLILDLEAQQPVRPLPSPYQKRQDTPRCAFFLGLLEAAKSGPALEAARRHMAHFDEWPGRPQGATLEAACVPPEQLGEWLQGR